MGSGSMSCASRERAPRLISISPSTAPTSSATDGLGRQGRRRRAHPREDRGGCGGPLRRHRLLGQARRAREPARPARARSPSASPRRSQGSARRSFARRRRLPTMASSPTGSATSAIRLTSPRRLSATPGVVDHGLFPRSSSPTCSSAAQTRSNRDPGGAEDGLAVGGVERALEDAVDERVCLARSGQVVEAGSFRR